MTIIKTTALITVRPVATFVMTGIVFALLAGCASHSDDFLSGYRPDNVGSPSEGAE